MLHKSKSARLSPVMVIGFATLLINERGFISSEGDGRSTSPV